MSGRVFIRLICQRHKQMMQPSLKIMKRAKVGEKGRGNARSLLINSLKPVPAIPTDRAIMANRHVLVRNSTLSGTISVPPLLISIYTMKSAEPSPDKSADRNVGFSAGTTWATFR
jgi:hypothetical protein